MAGATGRTPSAASGDTERRCVVGATVVTGTITVVVVVGATVRVGRATVVVVAGSSSPPPPPSSPPPPPPDGTVVVVTTVVDVVDVVDVVEVVVGASSSAFGAGVSNEYTNRLSEPAPGFMTTFLVDDVAMAEATSAGDIEGFCDRANAATPATCGAAIDVPDIERVALSELCPADTMLDPGANTSKHDPKLENDDRSSLDVVEPTVMASGSPAGDTVQALTLEFPAATTNVTPSATPRATARSSAADRGPPRLMLATAGTPLWWWVMIQSIPAMMSEVLPDPLQFITRIGTTSAAGATP